MLKLFYKSKSLESISYPATNTEASLSGETELPFWTATTEEFFFFLPYRNCKHVVELPLHSYKHLSVYFPCMSWCSPFMSSAG